MRFSVKGGKYLHLAPLKNGSRNYFWNTEDDKKKDLKTLWRQKEQKKGQKYEYVYVCVCFNS